MENLVKKKIVSVCAAASLASAALVGVSVVDTVPAQAVTCKTAAYWTSTAAAVSTTFTNSGMSGCSDLNAAYAHTKADKVMGQFKKSGLWQEASRGFVWVPATDGQWIVLISSLKDGSTVRGRSYVVDQYIQYVW